jgi:hypothetical protein
MLEIELCARFQAEWVPVGRPESALFWIRAHPDAKPGTTFAGCARARIVATAAL